MDWTRPLTTAQQGTIVLPWQPHQPQPTEARVMCVPQASTVWQGQPIPPPAPPVLTAPPRGTPWPLTVCPVTSENTVQNTT